MVFLAVVALLGSLVQGRSYDDVSSASSSSGLTTRPWGLPTRQSKQDGVVLHNNSNNPVTLRGGETDPEHEEEEEDTEDEEEHDDGYDSEDEDEYDEYYEEEEEEL